MVQTNGTEDTTSPKLPLRILNQIPRHLIEFVSTLDTSNERIVLQTLLHKSRTPDFLV